MVILDQWLARTLLSHLPGANAIRVSYSNGRALSDWILVEELPKLKSDWPLEPLKNGQDITNLKGELNDTLLLVGFQKRCSPDVCVSLGPHLAKSPFVLLALAS